MSKVIDLASRRMAQKKKGDLKNTLSGARAAPKPIDKQTYALWMFSQDVDALVAKVIIDKGLNLDEVAAILTHRLGTLARGSDHPERLVDFCKALLDRLSAQTPPESPTGVG